jgi:spore germination cell wall hydrolase CwlJ-like protein
MGTETNRPTRKIQSAGRIVGFCINAFWIGGTFAIASGLQQEAVANRDSRVVVQLSPSVRAVQASLSSTDQEQVHCLAQNMYFEAGNQGEEGMAAVTDVVFNRLHKPEFPGSVCEIITQHNQFSWVEDGKDHVMADNAAAESAYRIALQAWKDQPMHYKPKHEDFTGGATRYHAWYVSPKWKRWVESARIGAHIFYKPEQKGTGT